MENGCCFFSSQDQKEMKFCMKLSFVFGIFMLLIKVSAYYITGSTAVLSDAAESVIHVFAVGFAAYSMKYSLKPADDTHLYGHEKISFFSAGFEGAMIVFAAIYIYYESISKIIQGVELEHIGVGIFFVVASSLVNFFLGCFLLRKGKKYKSIILQANGKHILTDCLTSLAVVLALVLIRLTGVVLLDPILALLAATNIVWTGGKLVMQSVRGLMDETDPFLHRKIVEVLNEETRKRNVDYHHLRHRRSGHTVFIEFHLLFPSGTELEKAHEIATEIEVSIQSNLELPMEILTHLEPRQGHDEIHKKYGRPI